MKVFICLLIVLIGSIYFKSSLISVVISLCGILYTYLIAKKSRLGYFFGIINVTLYGLLLYTQKIYVGCIYNLFYSLPILIYGYYYWSNNDKINTLKNKTLYNILIVVVFIVGFTNFITSSNILTTLDILASLFGCIGIYLLSNKYIEQWPIWIMSNTFNVILWVVLTVSLINNLPVLLMWIFYLINSIYGYINWHKSLSK